LDSEHANTTANNNTAVGLSALKANTTGCQNVAVGSFALDSNTTASNNTAVGYNSLRANTGAGNVSLGTCALRANTTASNNVAVGYLSLYANTTGNTNVAVGTCSLNANVTHNSNSAFGFESLKLSTAEANTGIGYRALCSNTTGQLNTALGTSAGRDITTGDNNLLLGYYAGRSGSPSGVITTQSNIAVYGDNNMTDHYMAGDLRLTTGGLYVGGSADANKLDDYEEGTFTPTANTSTGASVPLDSAIDILSYTKIGRQVHIQGLLRLGTITSLSGTFFQIIGLPFTTASSATIPDYGARGGGGIFYNDAGTWSVVPYTYSESQSRFNILKDASTLGTSDDIQVSFSYVTD
jgi:hypothetical protein